MYFFSHEICNQKARSECSELFVQFPVTSRKFLTNKQSKLNLLTQLL